MKTGLLALFLIVNCHHFAYSQYYFRGELKDEQGNGLQNVRFNLFSKGTFPFFTGSNGVFGTPSSLKLDTVTFIMEGYDTLKQAVNTSQVGSFVLKASRKKKVVPIYLASKTTNFPYSSIDNSDESDKFRSSFIENGVVNTATYPETNIGLQINKSSYGNIRRIINAKEKALFDEVRIEEMLNYFNIRTKETEAGSTFTLNTQLTSCPWNEQNRLLFVNVLASKLNLDKTPPANLVFLIDASGSMDMINRMPLIKSAFKLFAENLRPTDKVSIVTYGDAVTELMNAVSGSEKKRIIETIEGLRPNGSTPGASAIKMAYAKARDNFVPGGNNRIIMATDGDFNVGETNAKGLQELVSRESKNGIYLTCLGVGIDKDELLEALARAGQGHFAYLDNENDAEKVLVEEFAQTTYAVAKNVSMNVQFNPSAVKAYHLIGFDNKRTSLEAKISSLNTGDIGSGQALMAAFEITPSGNDAASLATVKLSYQLPEKPEIITKEYQAPQNYISLDKADTGYKLATAVIGFGQLLQQTDFCKDFNWSQLEELAGNAVAPGDLLQKEFTELISKARKIYPAHRKSRMVKAQ